MDSRGKILIFATISALFLSFPAPTKANWAPKIPLQTLRLITNVCKRSDDYKSCFITLTSNPKISSATNIVSLAKIALQAVSKESGSVQAFLGATMKSYPKASQTLKSCVSFFKDTKKELVLRDDDLKAGIASLDVHTALDSVTSCETALAAGGVNIRAVSHRIKKWKIMFDAAFAAVDTAEG